MAESFAHCLFAMALQGVIGWLFGLPLLSMGVFIAGITAMALDMDLDVMASRKRSVYSHSLLFSLVWIYLAWTLTTLFSWWTGLKPAAVSEITLAVSVGILSHLLLDALTKDGVYTAPSRRHLRSALDPHPSGSRRVWGAWRLFPSLEWRSRRGMDEEDGRFNTLVSVASLLMLVLYIGCS